MPFQENCLRALFVYYRSAMCWAIALLALIHAWDTYYPASPAPSLAGLYAAPDCSGANLLLERLLLPPGLHIDAAQPTACHFSPHCGAAQRSLNATFLNASVLALQGFSGSNCSGNVTYSAALALPGASGGGGGAAPALAGCVPHANGSALFAPNYNDPEAQPLYYYYFTFVLQLAFQRPASIVFLLLLLMAARGSHVELVDGFKVVLEPWEAARAASAAPVHRAAALALFAASQAFFAADYAQGAAFADACALQTVYFPYFWFWVSFAAELAALLALVVHLQLARLARDGYCFGGSAVWAIGLHLWLAGHREARYTPQTRPHRTPCTASASATALALALAAALSAAATLARALAPALAPALDGSARALALAGAGALAASLAALAWGCWAARGVTGVGCQRGLRRAHHCEPPRYASPQALTSAELFSPARLWAALRRRGLVWAGGAGGGAGGGGGGGGGAGGARVSASSSSASSAPPELYLLHLSPSDTRARLASCLECWKAARACPGTGGAEGAAHSLHHTCGICLDSTRSDRQWMALACTHLYHAQCILQWVRVAHGNRTGLPACPLDQLPVTRRAAEESNSWSQAAEASGKYWVEHTALVGARGSAVLETYYSSGSRRMRELPAGVIVMTPVVMEEEEEEEEEGGEEGEGEGEGAAAGGAAAAAAAAAAAVSVAAEPAAAPAELPDPCAVPAEDTVVEVAAQAAGARAAVAVAGAGAGGAARRG